MNLKYKKLGEVCEILDSRRIPITASERKAGQYPYYGANGIQDYVADFIFDDELVLLAEDGGNFGSSDRPIAYRVSGKCWVNNHAHVLKPLPGIDVDYLCYALMFYDTSGLVNGATRQKLTQAAMRQMEIPIRSWDEQKTIVKKIKSAAGLITLRKSQVQKLDQLASSRFIEMFGDPIANPKSWTTGKLSEVTDKIGSGATPQGGKESYITSGISLIRSMNIHNGKFEYKDLAHITEEQAQQLNNVNVKSKDVFINITGASVARSCVVPDDVLPARVNQHVSIIRCKQNILNPIFANSLFISLPYQRTLLAIGESGGATRQAITKQQLENLMIILPSLELQNEFAAFVEQLDKSKVTIRKSIEKLETTYRALLQEYFG